MEGDRALEVLASRQYGTFSLAQARAAGISKDMVYRRVRSGAWVSLAPKVFSLASAAPRWERQMAAAVLSRPRAVVSGRSAAYILGFEGFRPGRPEITVPADGNPRSPIARVVRSTWFDELETVRRAGLTVTTPAETLLSLAACVPATRVEGLLDDALTLNRVAIEDFEIIRRRVAGGRVRGSRVLFPLLDERATDAWEPPGNQLEKHLDRLVDHPEVPAVSRQVPFTFETLPMIVDRFIGHWRLILEADGRRWHTRRADFERDRARDNVAAAHGLVVLRFTWRMLTEDLAGCRRILLQTGATRVPI